MIKSLSILGVVLLMFGTSIYSQSSVESIAIKLCNNLSEINLERSDEEIVKESLQTITATYQNLQDQILDLLPEYSKTYQNMSDIEISKIAGRDLIYFLMKDCPAFQSMTMFDNQPVPEISPEIETLGEYFTKLLTQKTIDTTISNSIIDECINIVVTKYIEDLGDNFNGDQAIKFDIEFNAYIMTKCDPYMKWLASQVDY